jgi:hypothetical protein
MNAFIVRLLLLFILGLFLTIVYEGIFKKKVKSALIQLLALAIAVVVLNLTTGFPSIRPAFGTYNPFAIVSLLLAMVIIGMVANYFFFSKKKFVPREFLKPFFVSPIVLLPLLGTLDYNKEIEPVQIISLCFLAFQNGFFWKEIFSKALKNE